MLIVWPLLPGHEIGEVATGPIEVVVVEVAAVVELEEAVEEAEVEVAAVVELGEAKQELT